MVLILGSPHHFNVYIVLVALVPKLWFLVPVCYVPHQVPVVGNQCPVALFMLFLVHTLYGSGPSFSRPFTDNLDSIAAVYNNYF